jgi:hypothetical protein
VNEDIVIPIAGMLFVLVLVFGSMFMYGYVKRSQRREALPRDPEADERLERMEHAIDAVAIEVERIAEGQRFVTKLLAERAPQPIGIPASTAAPIRRSEP